MTGRRQWRGIALMVPCAERTDGPRIPTAAPSSELRPLFVGRGVAVKGALRSDGTIRIDGLVEGEVVAGVALIVGEGAVVTARVTAGLVVSRGTITGDITAREKVVLHATARLTGTVEAPRLSIEEGAVFTGRLVMGAVPAAAETKVRQAV